MATLSLDSTFTVWSLTEEEQLQGAILNQSQKQVLQNRLADIADQKLNLTFDPVNPTDFALQDSFLRGQMDIIRFFLLSSNESEEQLRFRTQQSPQD